MTSNRNGIATQGFAWAAAALVSVGCGTSGTVLRAPVQSVGVGVAGGRSTPTCTLEGAPRVVATKVAPYAGINAEADGARVLLRLLSQQSALAATLVVEPQSLDAVDGTELGGSRLVDGTDELGESLAAGTVAQTLWETPAPEAPSAEHAVSGPSDALREPGLARVDSERWVSVWTTGSMNTGMDVRIQTADRKGTPIGAPITLASDGRAFGAPAVAIGASGRGVVAFLQSGDHGFALVAASLDCHVPQVPEMAAGWAMH